MSDDRGREGEGIRHSAPVVVVLGVLFGLGVDAAISQVLGGPFEWNEDFALLMGLLMLAVYIEVNADW